MPFHGTITLQDSKTSIRVDEGILTLGVSLVVEGCDEDVAASCAVRIVFGNTIDPGRYNMRALHTTVDSDQMRCQASYILNFTFPRRLSAVGEYAKPATAQSSPGASPQVFTRRGVLCVPRTV